MHVVAIVRLETSVDDEAQALAARFGTTVYEERLKLLGGMPAIVLSTRDEARATELLAHLTSRGHAALACDASTITATNAMVSLRRFRFDDSSLVAFTEQADELPWHDVSALLRATHRTQRRTTRLVKTTKLDLGKAILTGGLAATKTARREVVQRDDLAEPVLYIFRHSEKPPWILQQHRAQYGFLGTRLSPNAGPNFALTVDELIARCPHARFDDRLVARRAAPEVLDILAHLLATWIRRDVSPYR